MIAITRFKQLADLSEVQFQDGSVKFVDRGFSSGYHPNLIAEAFGSKGEGRKLAFLYVQYATYCNRLNSTYYWSSGFINNISYNVVLK